MDDELLNDAIKECELTIQRGEEISKGFSKSSVVNDGLHSHMLRTRMYLDWFKELSEYRRKYGQDKEDSEE